ncbi:MAG: flagellar protein FlaG [Veillonellaceae bacterium]|nr:flagellar protein FlaG [Veillonellaceae bacterium]
MEVSALKQISTQQNYNSVSSSQMGQADAANKAVEQSNPEQGSSAEKAKFDLNKPLSERELSELTYEMNKFLEMVNSDIQFSVHEKTNRLIVRVVDTRDNKVLKEFPPHEMLDTIAKIRDYVGLLLDKKV